MMLNVLNRGVHMTRRMERALSRKILSAFDRFSGAIQRIDLLIEDLNGPRGGLDKRVRLIVAVSRGGQILLEERSETTWGGVSRAVHRATQSLGRWHSRRVDHRG